MWDTTSTPFITDNGNGRAVNIPSTFFSWKGHALDHKTPLLRSERALSEQGVRLLKVLGQKGHKYLRSDCGAEQVCEGCACAPMWGPTCGVWCGWMPVGAWLWVHVRWCVAGGGGTWLGAPGCCSWVTRPDCPPPLSHFLSPLALPTRRSSS